MKRSLPVLILCLLASAAMALAARAQGVRPGDRLKLKVSQAFNAYTAKSGDSLKVTLPDGLQVDPTGKPEIPAGTAGLVSFRLVEKTPTAVKYDISSFRFDANSGHVEIKTALPAGDASLATIPVVKASMVKKILLPPLFGFLIWKDSAVLSNEQELTIEVAEEKRW